MQYTDYYIYSVQLNLYNGPSKRWTTSKQQLASNCSPYKYSTFGTSEKQTPLYIKTASVPPRTRLQKIYY